jgi:hypothetical protein
MSKFLVEQYEIHVTQYQVEAEKPSLSGQIR